MLRRFVFFALVPTVLIALCPRIGHAQVNTEKLRHSDVDGIAATFESTVTLESGNSELFETGVALRVDYRTARHYTFLLGSVRYGERRDKAYKNHAFAHLRYNYALTPLLVGEAFGQLEHDGFTLLRVRFLLGAGLRFRYVQSDRIGLYQGSSLMYEAEDLDPAGVGTHPAHLNVARWSNYVSARVRISDVAAFTNTVYVQPRIDAFGDLRLLDEAILSVNLTGHVALRMAFNLRYDSQPPGDIEPLDLSLNNGFSVTF